MKTKVFKQTDIGNFSQAEKVGGGLSVKSKGKTILSVDFYLDQRGYKKMRLNLSDKVLRLMTKNK